MNAEAAARTTVGRRIALSALLLGTFMGVLDVFIVTLALPSIRAELGTTFGETQLIIAGYAMAYAVGLITGGRLGDLYGRRRTFLAGMGVFVTASVACGVAGDPAALIVARVIQGLAAAAMLPQVLSIIRANLPGSERGAAVGWYGAVVGLGAVSGPTVGGLLVGSNLAGWGWRWVFLVNVPIGVVALVGVVLTVAESRTRDAVGLDLPGVGLATVGLAALLIPLTQGAEGAWPQWMLASLAAAPVLLGAFVTYERRLSRNSGSPLLPPALLANRHFTVGTAAILVLYAGDALFFLLSYYLQEGMRLSPARSGLLLAPVGLGFALASAVAPRLTARLGLLVPAGGIVLNIAGLAGLIVIDATLAAADRPPWLLWSLLLVGVGHGLAANPIISLVISSVAKLHAGAASGILLTTTQVANALGVAIAGSTFRSVLTANAHQPSAAAFSQALTWSVLLLIALTSFALPLLHRLRAAAPPTRR